MKKYFLHNGTEQKGAYTIEELKQMDLTDDLMIWYEGLDDWTGINNVLELKDLLKKESTPPPFKKVIPPPLSKQNQQSSSIFDNSDNDTTLKKGKMSNKKLVFIILGVVFLFGALVCYIARENSIDYEINDARRNKTDFIKDCLKLVVAKDKKVFDYIAEHHIPESESVKKYVKEVEEDDFFETNFPYYHNLSVEQINSLQLIEIEEEEVSFTDTKTDTKTNKEVEVSVKYFSFKIKNLELEDSDLDEIIVYEGKYYWCPIGW